MGLVDTVPSPRSIIISVIVVAYVLIYKIPIPCFGCESDSIWYRCTEGTGKGSKSCSNHKKVMSAVKSGKGFLTSVSEQGSMFMNNVWEFAKEDLPDALWEFIEQIKLTLYNLGANMRKKMQQIVQFLQDKATTIVDKIKNLAVDGYENYLRVVIDPIIAFAIKYIISPMRAVFTQLVEFRQLILTTMETGASQVKNLQIGKLGAMVVNVFEAIPETLRDLRVLIVDLVNKLKNSVFKGMNWGLASSTNLVNSSVNGLSTSLEKSLDETVDVLNLTVKGTENAVGGIVDGVNNTINHIQDRTNQIGDGIENAINGVVDSINKVDDAFEKIGGIKIVGKRFFGFMSDMVPRIRRVNVGSITIRDIKKPSLNRVKAPDVPNININAPTIKAPEDLTAKNLKFPAIPGLGWVSPRLTKLKDQLTSIFEDAMAPLYKAVQVIWTLIMGVVSSIIVFAKTYVNFSYLKEGFLKLHSIAGTTSARLREFVLTDVIPGLKKLFWTVTDPIVDFVQKAAEITWKYLKIVGKNAAELVKKVAKVAYKFWWQMYRNIWSFAVYTYGLWIDKMLFFVPGPVTFKGSLFLIIVMYIMLGPWAQKGFEVTKFLFKPVKAGLVFVDDLDLFLDQRLSIR